ncbi:unnamed protein product [Schistosoma bovis]|nr:unnamed protein product [Schistosoma bovis]
MQCAEAHFKSKNSKAVFISLQFSVCLTSFRSYVVLLNIVFAQRGYLNCGGCEISNTTQFPKLVVEIYLDQFPAFTYAITLIFDRITGKRHSY